MMIMDCHEPPRIIAAALAMTENGLARKDEIIVGKTKSSCKTATFIAKM